MAFEFDAPEADEIVGGSLYLDEPGIYHVVVTEVEEEPTNRDGNLLDGFRVKFSVLAGTVEGQKDKSVSLIFFWPNMGSKDGGAFAKRKQARFLYAVGLLDESKLGKRVNINLNDAVGRQCIIQLEKQDEESRFLQLRYDNIWHVDHPDAAKFPKDEEALKLIPKELRRSPDSFPSRTGGGAKKKPVVDLDEL